VQNGDETRVVLDAAQTDLDIARTQVRSAELAVFAASPGGSDYTTGQTQRNQAKANLDAARRYLDGAGGRTHRQFGYEIGRQRLRADASGQPRERYDISNGDP